MAAPAILFLFCVLAADKPDFARDVQPILNRSCVSCHGAKAQLGSLRLDSRKAAAKSIQAGNPEDSTLYQRVAGIGDQARMPMGGKPLPPHEIELIKKWIAEGAEWPEALSVDAEIKKHWAYIPPTRPASPAVSSASWIRNEVDKFVLARLDKEGLKPSPEADRITLLRRVSLDLTGLPPTPAEVDAFLADRSPNAYETQVDRLLASPHYGERWARHWLDAARYADSDGFEKDKQRSVWFYRDWVINAHNRDLPYNRFVIEQIAGDLLPNATQDQLVATGFLRNSMINEEGGVDPEQFRMEAMFDRMDAIGKAVLGVTIGCAQCHNHKFDPLKQEEYYQMFAFLNSSHEGSITVYTPAEQQQRAEILGKITEIENELKHRSSGWEKKFQAWKRGIETKRPDWKIVTPEVEDISTGGQKYLAQPDGSMLAAGYAPTKHRAHMIVKTDLKKISAVRLELLLDPDLPHGGPGRSLRGTAALTEFEVEAEFPDAPGKLVPVCISRASADVNIPESPLGSIYHDKSESQKAGKRVTGPIRFAIDGNRDTAWETDAGPGRRNVPRQAVFNFDTPVVSDKGVTLHIYLRQDHGGWNSDDNQSNNLGKLRLALTDREDAEAEPPLTFSRWRETVPAWKSATEKVEALWRQHPEGTSQLVLAALEKDRQTNLLMRGDFLKPGKPVSAGVPAFLNPLPANAPVNRLTFAEWLVDRQAPTTARAFVNRVWQNYFGTGLVATSEDLGKQAEAPSHPELLDWLAVEFMDSGWSMKKLHRLIVTSAVYRQSSAVTPELRQRDPYNRLLARGSRLRVEGEIVRDIALAASGLLNAKVGGPSVYPPAPDFLFQPPASYGPKIWTEEKGVDRYRRALYTFRYRSVPYPMLQNFDTPNGDVACVRRVRSNTPLQALTTLNEPLFMEAAKALAEKTVREGGASDSDRVEYMFRRCVSRRPTGAERDELLSFVNKQKGRGETLAWTALARAMLNLDETITRE
jgi:hypothetical protein